MTEIDVTLTDLILFFECIAFAFLLKKSPGRLIQKSWIAVFLSAGIGALLGALVHGFGTQIGAGLNDLAWKATLFSLGVMAMASLDLAHEFGGKLHFSRKIQILLLVIYLVAVIGIAKFWIAIVFYLPSTIYWFMVNLRQNQVPLATKKNVTIGLALTLLGAIAQQGKIAIHPLYFNHNSVFHVIQMVALFFLYRAARTHLQAEGSRGKDA